jgi:hypothetical protein
VLKNVFFSKKPPYLLKYLGLTLKCKKMSIATYKKTAYYYSEIFFRVQILLVFNGLNSNHCSHPTAQLYAIHLHSFVFVLATTNYFHTLKWQ